MSKITIKNEKFVKYDAFPVHINKKAHKLWAGKVVGYEPDDKYSIKLDWLSKEYLDRILHYDVSGVVPGDIIKVNAGSHKNRYPTYYKITNKTSNELEVKKMSESKVIDEFKEESSLKQKVLSKISNIEDKDKLQEILNLLEG